MATLLEITQEILSVMTSDEVNSISDTAEAEAVARIVMATFDNMVSTRNWKNHKELLKLVSHSSSARPTHSAVPANTKELLFVNYNKTKSGDSRLYYEPVKWKEPDQFTLYTNGRDSTSSTVQTVTDGTGVVLLIANDKQPQWYTSFDDDNIVFDSFDSAVDSTIQTSKIQAFGYIQPVSTFSNTWEPDIPKEAIRSLIEQAKSTARFQLDSVTDIKAEQEALRQRRWLSQRNWTVNGGLKYPNYGRKSTKGARDATFKENR